eukprot:6184834-Pleurochrysis_carterae.AAC.1
MPKRAAVAGPDLIAHESVRANSAFNNCRVAVRCFAGELQCREPSNRFHLLGHHVHTAAAQLQIEFSMARTPAKSPVKNNSK